ncbi:MAG: TIM barrel protein, partial [Nitrospirota bacterium]
INEVGRENVGCLLDTGHASAGGENVAESIALLNMPNCSKLSYVHFNDNWHTWDDDMMAGSIHTFELLETLYWLKRTGYRGWLTLDIFPYRENGVQAATESIGWIKGLLDKIDKTGLDHIGKVISKNDAIESSRMLRKIFL